MASDFTAATGTPVTTQFGPSGTLRQQIEAGARPDVFASADVGNPLALQAEGLAGPVVDFATNRVVAVARPGLAISSANLLSTLLDPAVKLGTSTPLSDPLGDYTEQVFANADALDPGAKATLDAKAQRLVGGPSSPTVPAGQNSLVYFIEGTQQADVFLTYYSSAVAALAIAPDLQEVDLPAGLALPPVAYGLTIINGADPGAASLENYILSPAGQSALVRYGFGAAVATAVPEPASLALLGAALAGLAVAMRRNRATERRT